MTLLFADSFDHYNTTLQMARKWDGPCGGAVLASGRNRQAWLNPGTYKNINNLATVIVGQAILSPNGDQYTGAFLSLRDGGTVQVDMALNANGSISVRRNGTTTLGTSAASTIRLSTWHYVELKVLINNTSGTVDVKVDGTNVLSLSSQNTQQTANAYATTVNLDHITGSLYRDDFYICDANGTANNDFLGDIKVESLMPNSAGTTTQFTPSVGANYTCVDELISNDDTDYVESSTVGQIDLYNYESLATTNGTILAVQANLMAEKTDANVRQIRENCRVGATTYAAGTTFTLDSGYLDHRFIREVSPNTGVAWTIAEINASEWGIEVVA